VTRDPDAPSPIVDLAAHRQRVPTLPTADADRLLDAVTDTSAPRRLAQSVIDRIDACRERLTPEVRRLLTDAALVAAAYLGETDKEGK
jgi:hypothetical protein